MPGLRARFAVTTVFLLGLLASPAAARLDRPLGTNGAEVPQLEWSTCPASSPDEAEFLKPYECSVAKVPLSYRRPYGRTIELALGRLPATDQENKLGTLFWNPGGPGGSGRIPPPFSDALHKRFDIVGFDPRGIAASTPLKCFDSDEQAFATFGLQFPTTRTERETFIAANRLGTELCAERGGPVMRHMSTSNVARDLDLLRRAVGDRRLTYFGYSYGTAIGEYYANIFPRKVRALTLDGVVDPGEWSSSSRVAPIEYTLGSFNGTNAALNSFLRECAFDARCAFREPGVDLRQKYNDLIERVHNEPVVLGAGEGATVANYQFVVSVTLSLLYDATLASPLADVLQGIWEATEAPVARTMPRAAAAAVAGLRPKRLVGTRQDEPYVGLEWLLAVECTDSVNPRNPWQWPRFAQLADRQAFPFGSPWVYFSQPCATWPARDPDRYAGPWDRRTPPILLIGNSLGDPATPYEDARQTEELLRRARLLTLETFGHTAQGGRSLCIDSAVDRYLIDLELPRRGTFCRPDRRPFDPIPESLARKLKEREEVFPAVPVAVR